MNPRHRRASIVLAAIVALTGANASGKPWDESELPGFPGMPPRVIRDLRSPSHLWYSITYDLPAGKSIFIGIRGKVERGWTGGFCGELRAAPRFSYSGSLFMLTPAGDGGGSESGFYAEMASEGEHDTVLGSRPPIAGAAREAVCASMPTGPPGATVRRSEVHFIASDTRVRDSVVLVRADPGVRIVAESWGSGGIELLRDADFSGGRRVAAGARGMEPGHHPLASVDAVAATDRTHARRFQRSGSALFLAGWTRAYQGGLYPNFATLLTIEGPGRPPGTYRGDPISGDDDVTYTIGSTYFTGSPPGLYRFNIDALLAADLRTRPPSDLPPFVGINLLSRNGPDAWVALVTLDADSPACATSKVAWREPDRRKVCGPGPARMLRGLNP